MNADLGIDDHLINLSLSSLETVFTSVELTGQFQTTYIFPQLLTDGGLPDKTFWTYEDDLEQPRGVLKTTKSTDKPLLVAALYARKYEWDTNDINRGDTRKDKEPTGCD